MYNSFLSRNKIVGNYGVSFLDDYLLGIKQSDFIMIGAPTGTGKSNLAYQIAFNNAEKLNVHLFALEADIDEPYTRRLYFEFSRKLKEENKQYINFRDFSIGNIQYPLLLEEIEKQMVYKYRKLAIHYRDEQFTINTLISKLQEIANDGKCDMIILDHVDYFDIISDVNENYQVSEIMKLLRDINIKWGIPIILISHLRKKSNRKSIIPEIEDLFGTSNKPKQMKTIILLAPDFSQTEPSEGKFSTFFCIPKDRLFGGTHMIGQCVYLSSLGAYHNKYNLVCTKDHGETIMKAEIKYHLPWAKSYAGILAL